MRSSVVGVDTGGTFTDLCWVETPSNPMLVVADLATIAAAHDGGPVAIVSHGGAIRVVSEVGRGTTVTVLLPTAVGEAHLLNICVEPGWQGHGLGRRLLRRMLRIARERDADTMFLEVRVSNKAAQGLYEAEGFAEVGRRRDYYPARYGREDAIVYAKTML